MPEGVAALRSLEVEVPGEQSFPFRGIRFVEHGWAAQASFAISHGLGVRRTMLHRLLVERAQELGVKMHWGVNVTTGEKGVHCN